MYRSLEASSLGRREILAGGLSELYYINKMDLDAGKECTKTLRMFSDIL